MNVLSTVRRITGRGKTAAFAALALALPAVAYEAVPGVTLIVTVLPDRYVTADVAFVDLEALDETLVKPIRPAVLRLEACSPASANALLAAAEHFRGSRLELRTSADVAQSCTPPVPARIIAPRVVYAGGVELARRPLTPTERYWRSVMP